MHVRSTVVYTKHADCFLLRENQLISSVPYTCVIILLVISCICTLINFVCMHYVDEDIESAVSEYEQLVQAGEFSSQFPSSYSIVEFSNALYMYPSPPLAPLPPCYPYHHTQQRDHCPPEVIEVEEMSQSADGELNRIFRVYLERTRVIVLYNPPLTFLPCSSSLCIWYACTFTCTCTVV